MKKILAILLGLSMLLSLCACGVKPDPKPDADSSKPSVSESSPEAEAESSQEPAEESDAESAELKEGQEGEGPVTLDTVFFTVTIPEGMKYEIASYSVDESANPRGVIRIYFGKGNTSGGTFIVDTVRMIKSLSDAADECLRTKNLDTYKEGKYEMKDEISYGDTTYQALDTSTEYSAHSYLVSYYSREADGVDIYVEIETKTDGYGSLPMDDPLVAEMLNSIIYK